MLLISLMIAEVDTENISTLNDLYASELYSPQDFIPPAERRPHVLAFELATGCDWNRCSFCSGYKRIPYQEKTLTEFQQHVDQAFAFLDKTGYGQKGYYSFGTIRRIFIGGGNALSVETNKLAASLKYAADQTFKYTGLYPQRTALYGNIPTILGKSQGEFHDLKYAAHPSAAGLDLIYIGLESGSDEVLDYVNKGFRYEDILRAAKILDDAYIKTSVMIMPGLGGIKYYDQHVEKTAEVLEALQPDYITFMGVNAAENTPYARRMREELTTGTNRPLTDFEMVRQIESIVCQTSFMYRYFRDTTTIGCFGPEIDKVGYNPAPFHSTTMRDFDDKLDLLRNLDRQAQSILQRSF